MAENEKEAIVAAPPVVGGPSNSRNGHKHHKKDSDPFLNLDKDSVKISDLTTPSKENSDTSQSPHSLITDLILTPLNMITFVLSLSMIDFRQRQWRLSQHASGNESFWFQLTHWSWLHPEPYQDSRNSTWRQNDRTVFQNPPNADFQGWHTRKKHRAVTKMQISDAFEMRGRVFVALLAWAIMGVFGLSFAAKRLIGWVSST